MIRLIDFIWWFTEVPEADITSIETVEPEPEPILDTGEKEQKPSEYVNHRGIRFTPQEDGNLQPYGLACVRELFRLVRNIEVLE